MGEAERLREVKGEADDVGLGERSLAGDPRAETVGAEVHGEVDVAAAFADGADVNDVGVLEVGGCLRLVAEARLELWVARIPRLQHFDGDRRPVGLATGEHPGEAALAEQSLQLVGAERVADEIGWRVGHRLGFTKGRGASNLRRY